MSKSDAQIKMMQNMHKKMMGAKSPEERKALMVEHMKLMREGMAMMKAMGADGKPKMQGDMHKEMNMHQMMERRMEMMESMMQMMMDAMPMPAATK